MKTEKIKASLKNDIHALRSLDVDILDGKVMYSELLKIYSKVMLFLLTSVLTGALFVALKKVVFCDSFDCFASYTFMMFLSDMFFSLLITLGVSVLLLPAMNKYVIFKHTLKEKLKSGEYLDGKIIQLSKIAWLIYTLPLMVISAYNGCVFFSLIIMVFFSAFAIPFAWQFEIQRLGLNAFLNLISEIMERKPNVETI